LIAPPDGSSIKGLDSGDWSKSVEADLKISAICHAPWLLAEAGMAEGREITSYHGMRTDLKTAGAHEADKEVAISNNIITSRAPDDLEAFVVQIIEEVEKGEQKRDPASPRKRKTPRDHFRGVFQCVRNHDPLRQIDRLDVHEFLHAKATMLAAIT